MAHETVTAKEVRKKSVVEESRRKKEEKARKKMQARGGWVLLSIMGAFIIIALILGGVYFSMKRAKRGAEVDTALKKVSIVLSVLDTINNLSGYYPAKGLAVDISSTDPFKRFLGTNVKDVESVTYQCPAGTASTYTVTFPDSFFGAGSTAVDICNAVAFAIKQQRRDLSTVTCDANGKMAITKKPVYCQNTY